MRKILFTLLLIGSMISACTGVQKDGSTDISGGPEAVRTDSVVYVDVRTPDEYASGHVTGSILIPHDQMEERWKELDNYRDQKIVVYCRSGRRSGIAESILEAKGFQNVENGGGFKDLVAAGIPATPRRDELQVSEREQATD